MPRLSLRRHAPLLLLVALELAWAVFLAVTRTIPRGHDGFQYFYLKYYFFNDFVNTGAIAQWMPYLTHGSPSAWWYVVQSGIFDLPVFVVARAVHLRNFMPVFYALLFLEQSLLVLGAWLLSGEHMEARVARFVATASIALTSIWYTGVWWNFHALLALPLMLYFLHRAIVQFRWTWLVGVSLLLCLQTFGNLSYYLPMTLLFLAAYAGFVLARPDARAALWAQFHVSPIGALAVVGINAGFLVELLWLRRASQEIAFGTSQRSADGSVTLETFLTHGGSMDLRPSIQLFSGLTPHLDYTLFAGFLIAGLTIVAVTSGPLNRSQRLFGWLSLITLLVGTSSPLAVFVYYFWPLGRLFRHLTLVLPVAKMFGAFLAGATLDRLLTPGDTRSPVRTQVAVAAVFAGWLALLVLFGISAESRQAFIAALTVSSLPAVDGYATLIAPRFGFRGAVFVALSGVVLLALIRSTDSKHRRQWIGQAAALVLLADLVTYGAQEMHERSLELSPREAALFQVSDLVYADRRSETTDDLNAPRRRTFSKTAAKLIGTRYWAESLLWFTDGYRTLQRTVLWSSAFQSYLEALRQRPDLARVGLGLDETLPMPLNDDFVSMIGGFRASKVRFFEKAMLCPDVDSSARVVADGAFRGQMPLLTAPVGPGGSVATTTAPALPVGTVPCQVTAIAASPSALQSSASARNVVFSSNRAEFVVSNPTPTPLVMTYSDTWSKYWRARIDGTETPVWRSDLAYKAVVVPPGDSRVAFEYRDDVALVVFVLQGVASTGLVLLLPLVLILRRREASPPRAA